MLYLDIKKLNEIIKYFEGTIKKLKHHGYLINKNKSLTNFFLAEKIK